MEAQRAVPGHVLDGHEGAVGDDDHVKVTIRHEHAVRGFDDLREDVLDWIGGEVAFAFGAAIVVTVFLLSTYEDGIDGTFGPADVLRGVDGGFHVGAVEICSTGSIGGVDELGGEADDVPKQRALLIDLVDVEARVVSQGGFVDQVENIAVGFAGEVEELGWLVSGRWEGEVCVSKVGVAARLVKAFELREERVIEFEEGLVLQDERYGRHLFLRPVELADARVVD